MLLWASSVMRLVSSTLCLMRSTISQKRPPPQRGRILSRVALNRSATRLASGMDQRSYSP